MPDVHHLKTLGQNVEENSLQELWIQLHWH